jgi:hypothetical protein
VSTPETPTDVDDGLVEAPRPDEADAVEQLVERYGNVVYRIAVHGSQAWKKMRRPPRAIRCRRQLAGSRCSRTSRCSALGSAGLPPRLRIGGCSPVGRQTVT